MGQDEEIPDIGFSLQLGLPLKVIEVVLDQESGFGITIIFQVYRIGRRVCVYSELAIRSDRQNFNKISAIAGEFHCEVIAAGQAEFCAPGPTGLEQKRACVAGRFLVYRQAQITASSFGTG